MTHFFWLGVQHPLAVPGHLLALLALGLLTGQQGIVPVRRCLPGFGIALVAGLVLTRYLSAPWDANLFVLVLACAMGILAALQLRLPVWLMLVLAVVVGLVIGLDSGVGMIPGMRIGRVYASLSGAGLGASLGLLMAALAGFLLHKLWQGIGVRVLGAWITAGAVMVLTLELTGALRAMS